MYFSQLNSSVAPEISNAERNEIVCGQQLAMGVQLIKDSKLIFQTILTIHAIADIVHEVINMTTATVRFCSHAYCKLQNAL